MTSESLAEHSWEDASQNFDALPASSPFPVISKQALQREIARATARVEARFLEALMRHCGGNVTAAAKASGIHRSHLQRMLSRRHRG